MHSSFPVQGQGDGLLDDEGEEPKVLWKGSKAEFVPGWVE